MNVLIAMLAGLAGALVGAFLGFMAASAYASATHMSTMEGAAGYFAASIGLIVGFLCMVGAMVGTLMWRGASLQSALSGSAMGFVGIAALTVLAVGAWYAVQPHILGRNGPTPLLEFQIAANAGAQLPAYDQLSIELQTDRNGNDGIWRRDVEKDESGTLVRAGYVSMYFRTSQRMLVLKLPDGRVQIFKLKLPGDPSGKKYRTWSAWQNADFVDDGKEGAQPRRASAEEAYRIRYWVETYEQP